MSIFSSLSIPSRNLKNQMFFCEKRDICWMFLLKYTYDANVTPGISFSVNVLFLNFVLLNLHQIWICQFFPFNCPNDPQPEMHIWIVYTSVGTGRMTLNTVLLFVFKFSFYFDHLWLQRWQFDLASFESLPIRSDGKDDPEPSRFLTTKHAAWHHVQLALKQKLIWNIKN